MKNISILVIIVSLLIAPSTHLVSQEFNSVLSNNFLVELEDIEQILIHKIELIGAWIERDSFDKWTYPENPLAKHSQYCSFESSLPNGKYLYVANNNSVEVWEGSRKLAVITQDKIIAPARVSASEVGNKVINGNKLVPNMKYDVDGFSYQTDSNGLVKAVSAKIFNATRIRLDYQQAKSVKIKDGLRGDQGAHLIAARFFGPGEQINVVPMSDELNLGRWKLMENSWAEAFNANKFVEIKVEIRVVYDQNSKRPIKFLVDEVIDGVIKPTKEFSNVGL